MSGIKKLVLNNQTFIIDTDNATEVNFISSDNKKLCFNGDMQLSDIILSDSNASVSLKEFVYNSGSSTGFSKYINVYSLNNTISVNCSLINTSYLFKGNFISDHNNDFTMSTNNDNEFTITYTGTSSENKCMYNINCSFTSNPNNKSFMISILKNNIEMNHTIYYVVSESTLSNVNMCGIFELSTNDTINIAVKSPLDSNVDFTIRDFNMNLYIL